MPKKKTTERTNRCWPGYEPVPGKKAGQQGSCRPKAKSKLSSPEQKFRKKRRQQLDKWQAGHPHTRRAAAQHLHAPGTRKKSGSGRQKHE
jgi:hypothetical protein